MNIENVVIKPAGHEGKRGLIRTHTEGADSRLVDLALGLLAIPAHPGMYRYLCQELPKIPFTLEEMHALVLHPDIRNHKNAQFMGCFLSAAYNISPDQVIVYDLPIELYSLGYMCSKLLINRGNGGHRFADSAEGVTINAGQTGTNVARRNTGVFLNAGVTGVSCGILSHGILINDGQTEDNFAFGSKGKVVLLKEPESFNSVARNIRLHETSELFHYIRELEGYCKQDPADIIARYGTNPAETIKQDIKKLVEKEWQSK